MHRGCGYSVRKPEDRRRWKRGALKCRSEMRLRKRASLSSHFPCNIQEGLSIFPSPLRHMTNMVGVLSRGQVQVRGKPEDRRRKT
jgi:hypothetical protein